MPKHFTLAEAESLLPELERALGEILSAKGEYDRAEASLQATIHKIMMVGGMVLDSHSAGQDRSARDRSAEQLKAALEGIHEHGCLVKDLDTGLVDFPTLFRGQEVYLCWKLGEPAIRYWHGVEEGFAGRKPIDQDFLDNHQGDPLN